MAQSVKQPTLEFGSGHDLTVCEIEPHVKLYADSADPPGILSLPLSAPSPLACSLSLSIDDRQIER